MERLNFMLTEINENAVEGVIDYIFNLLKTKGFTMSNSCGWSWVEESDNATKTTCNISDIKLKETDFGYFIPYVIVEYKAINAFGFGVHTTQDIAIEDLREWLDNNDIYNYEYKTLLSQMETCEKSGTCKGTSCKYWHRCQG